MNHTIFLLVILFFSSAAADLAADGSALIAFRSAVGRTVLHWNTSFSPCKWKGVACSSNRVTALRLPGRSLIGQIPTGTLGNLSNLRILSLHHNALFGPLPSDLAKCTHLHYLNINRNRFSGEIPSSLNNLTQLTMLFLETNNFSGEIPNLDIPKLRSFNVSFNRINGSVPEKLRGMPARSFLGTSLCGGPLHSCPNEVSPALADSSSLSGGAIAGIVNGAVAVFLLILVVLFLFFRRKGEAKQESFTVANPPESVITANNVGAATAPSPGTAVSKKQLVFLRSAPRVFDLDDLLRASAEVLGRGSGGLAYKAAVEEDLVVAVKSLKNVNMPEKEFAEQVKAISAMEHPNILPLRAYYYSVEEKLLVYDYMPFGSLSSLLHGNRGYGRPPLKWESRIRIALEAARGIEYIHSTSPSASHGNIKSSNILITSTYRARVSDHGLAHLLPSSPAIDAQTLTPKADVFSFGVLLLELLIGKAPADRPLKLVMTRWVEYLIREERTRELFDEELMRYESSEEEMMMLLQIGLDCISQNPEHRPMMTSVVAKIEEIQHLTTRRKDMLKEKEDQVF